jgi:pimeloyl-ACP methyl ester carboxylesterase
MKSKDISADGAPGGSTDEDASTQVTPEVGMTIERVQAGALEVAFERHGGPPRWPVVLLHGFPYDPRCYDAVAALLVASGADVVIPYLRGYGPTRFVRDDTVRSGQQAALAHDLRELIEVLQLERPIVAGFDWGGRAACLVAALWPEKVAGLVTVGGYNVQNIAASTAPATPESERRLWYQYYLHGERGRSGLARYRKAFARLLWSEWSPTWDFSDATFEASAVSFENPDFVDVVVHSYRHRYGLVAGDPAYEQTEQQIAAQPLITVPTVVVDPTDATLSRPGAASDHAPHFSRLVEHRTVSCGHNPPQEAPTDFADALLALRGRLSSVS